MNVIKSGHIPSMFEKLNVGKALSLYDGGCLLGFTCVFNYTLKKIAFDNDADDMYSHDIWVQAVAVGMGGKFYYDEKVTAHFRRHDNTTSIAESEVDSSFVNAWKYRWNEMFGNGQVFNRIRGSIDSYFRLFYESVSGKEDKEFLLKFGQNKKGAASVFGKLFYRYRLKQSLLTEIAWRIAILFGKI